MKSVAIITYKDAPNLSPSDAVLVKIFERKSIRSTPVLWDSDNDWSPFDCLIIRSCWDYHTRVAEFREWCLMLKKQQIKVWNPIDIVLWNHEKTYLKDLETKGANIIPTEWYEKGSSCNVQEIIERKAAEKIIIKPTIGASAHGVLLADRNNAQELQPEVNATLENSGIMIQPFIKEVQTQGELSLMFAGREYTHAIVKFPKPGHHVGIYDETVRLIEPDVSIIKEAKRIVEMVESQILYARVDGFIVNGEFLLNELELIEPYLFFDLYPQGAEKFVEVLESL